MGSMMAGAAAPTARAWSPSPRLVAALVTWAAAVALVTAPLVGAPGLAAGAVGAATGRSIAGGEQVAAALETYALESGVFPDATGAAQLEAALGPFLPSGVRLSLSNTGDFTYSVTAHTVRLRYMLPGGVPTDLTLTAGVGGTLSAGNRTVSLPW